MSLINPDFNADTEGWATETPPDELQELKFENLLLRLCLASAGYWVEITKPNGVSMFRYDNETESALAFERLMRQSQEMYSKNHPPIYISWEGTNNAQVAKYPLPEPPDSQNAPG
jgi:hypothetical protein